jgi:hypothetical protein
MKEVEQYARDVLGMSRPDAHQIIVVNSLPGDRAEVIGVDERGSLREFGSFISSLIDYFR